MKQACYLGVDVGTGSVRAGLFDARGELLGSATNAITTWRSDTDHRIYEQSTGDIWKSVCLSVKEVLSATGFGGEDVKGIGFDATCSLAVIDLDNQSILVTGGEHCGNHGERNVILWADHRAEQEAELINKTGSVVLQYVGGTMSLEMEIPKILWLKNNMPGDQFRRCQFFDLPDFLTYRSTGSTQRSSCSLVCKCSYIPETGWQDSFFNEIGLAELVHKRYSQLAPDDVLTAGKSVGNGLTALAAEELGLSEGTPVGSAVIDAYAGWIGTVAARYHDPVTQELNDVPTLEASQLRLAAVAGTSTCHLIQSSTEISIPGVWGPYRDVVFPGWWMSEGGQSSTGQLIDFVLTTHPAYGALQEIATKEHISVYQWMENELLKQQKISNSRSLTELNKDLHLYPDLHGNRSPIGDPRMRGMIVGITLDSGVGDLARKYYATLESISLQTKHIIVEMNSRGHNVQEIYVSGGQAQNLLLMQLMSNVCNLPVVLPQSSSTAVLLGAAILGKCAAEEAHTQTRSSHHLWQTMTEMTLVGKVLIPNATAAEASVLKVKYTIFKEMAELQQRWRKQINAAILG